jgi:putative N-acetyltransferase (TIGR04045 family)
MSELSCREVTDPGELETCYAIRHTVFVEEQGLFAHDDRDEHDAAAVHYAVLLKDTIVGTVRIYRDPDGIWWGGRLAVLRRYRGRAGRLLVQTCVEHVRRQGAVHFRAFVQEDNVAFFKTLNWTAVGTPVLICNRSHQLMEAAL